MDLAAIEGALRRHRNLSVLLGLILTFAGIGLLLDRPKTAYLGLVGLPLLLGGLAVFALLFRREAVARPTEARRTLASRLLDRLTFRRRLVPWFPVLAIGVLAMDLAYNLLVFDAISLGTEDTMVLLFAAVLFAYPFVPARFGRERDFVLMFVGALIGILVLPLLLARLYSQDFTRSVDVYSWVALAPQTAIVLNALGVPASVGPWAGGTAPALTFTTRSGATLQVVITTACSGIYSFGIFASAFAAFVATEFERFRPRVLGLLFLGFVTSYVANILRMVLIVLIGVYGATEEQALSDMLVAHSNLGWIIFLAWIGLFWGLAFTFVVRRPDGSESAPAPPTRKRGVLCGICEEPLTPALPGYRCECGKFYHVACAATVEECPRCHRPMRAGATDVEATEG